MRIYFQSLQNKRKKMNKLNNLLDSIAKPFMPITPWLLRLGLGISFILHGETKLPLPSERMVPWLESMGYMHPELVSGLVAIGEIAAGVGIILGGLLNNKAGQLMTRLSGGAVGVIMIGAILIAHSDWLVTRKLFMSEQIFLFLLGTYFAIRGNK